MNYSKHIFKVLTPFIFVLACLIPEAFAAERFVAVCANNGDGTTSSCASSPGGAGAFNTIQAGINAAIAGDTITVLDGTYDTGTTSGEISAIMHITKAGTADKPITIRSQNKHGATIDATGKTFAIFIYGSADYVTIDGFDLHHSTTSSVIFIRTNPLHGQGGGGFMNIINNKIHNGSNDSTDCEKSGGSGIFEDSHDVLIKGNMIYENGRLLCTVHSFQGHGLYMTGYNFTIAENVIYGNASAGIQIRFKDSQPAPNGANAVVRNNVIYDQKYGPGMFVWCDTGCIGQTGLIENNIIYHNKRSAINLCCGASAVVNYLIHYNIINANPEGSVINEGNGFTGTITIQNNIDQNPLFVSELTQDFHLQSQPPSPGKGTGFGGVDMGAYPQGDVASPPPDTTAPSPPTGLQATD